MAKRDHGLRIGETTMGLNQSICPLSLLFKDHKGWSPSEGTVPPTRPVVGGHLGINLHISELMSDIFDPVVIMNSIDPDIKFIAVIDWDNNIIEFLD